jgi:transposase
VACPVVTEAVKAATPESKIAMAIAAIESDIISTRAAAERFDVAESTLRVKRSSSPAQLCAGEEEVRVRAIAKNGRAVGLPATQEEVKAAWALRDSGKTVEAIAADLNRSAGAIHNWLKKPRPEQTAPTEPPPLTLESPSAAPKPKRPQVPDSLKQVNQRERRWLRERWIQIADHLAKAEQLIRLEHHRLQSEYAGPQGSLMMTNRWEALAKLWAESGEFQDFTAATGNPEAVTLAGLFSELERSSRVSSQLIGSIETWTGCRPDPTRYQPPTP